MVSLSLLDILKFPRFLIDIFTSDGLNYLPSLVSVRFTDGIRSSRLVIVPARWLITTAFCRLSLQLSLSKDQIDHHGFPMELDLVRVPARWLITTTFCRLKIFCFK